MPDDEMWEGFPKTLKYKGVEYALRGKARVSAPEGERGLYRYEKTWLLVTPDLKKKVEVEAGGGGFPKGSWLWVPNPRAKGRQASHKDQVAATAPTVSIPASATGRNTMHVRPLSPEESNECGYSDCKNELRASDGHYHSTSDEDGFPLMVCCVHLPKDKRTLQCGGKTTHVETGKGKFVGARVT